MDESSLDKTIYQIIGSAPWKFPANDFAADWTNTFLPFP
ncbi:hypothetical protein FHS11_005221, partial [Mucilaginibacter gotjawali]|nr:hypothetical protein [Mucilaginibacter gotjawali]